MNLTHTALLVGLAENLFQLFDWLFLWFGNPKPGLGDSGKRRQIFFFYLKKMIISNSEDLLGYILILCNYIIMGTLQKTLQYALRQSHHSEELMKNFKMEIKVILYSVSPHMVFNKLLRMCSFSQLFLRDLRFAPFLWCLSTFTSKNEIVLLTSELQGYSFLYMREFPHWILCLYICCVAHVQVFMHLSGPWYLSQVKCIKIIELFRLEKTLVIIQSNH